MNPGSLSKCTKVLKAELPWTIPTNTIISHVGNNPLFCNSCIIDGIIMPWTTLLMRYNISYPTELQIFLKEWKVIQDSSIGRALAFSNVLGSIPDLDTFHSLGYEIRQLTSDIGICNQRLNLMNYRNVCMNQNFTYVYSKFASNKQRLTHSIKCKRLVKSESSTSQRRNKNCFSPD